TGINNGTTNKLNNTPPFLKPTVNATPTAPKQLKIGVPTNKVCTNAHHTSTSSDNKSAAIGDNSIKGKPVNNKCEKILASAVIANGIGNKINCSKEPSK